MPPDWLLITIIGVLLYVIFYQRVQLLNERAYHQMLTRECDRLARQLYKVQL